MVNNMYTMIYELEIITDITKTNATGKVLSSRKDVKIRKVFDLDKIELEEYMDNKSGKVIKKYSSITHNNSFFKINKPYEELKRLIINQSIPVLGLAYKSKRYR